MTPTARLMPLLPRLLGFYLRGRIGETTWYRLMRVCDDRDVSLPERQAFAGYVHDALRDGGMTVPLPRPREMHDLLAGLGPEPIAPPPPRSPHALVRGPLRRR